MWRATVILVVTLLLHSSQVFPQQRPATAVQGAMMPPVYSQFTPSVVRSDRVEGVLFEVKVEGDPTRVLLDYHPGQNATNARQIEMRDDGTGGDRKRGDGVYTLTLQPSQIVQNLRADDVFRPFIGFLDIFRAEARTFHGNIFAEVITDEMPRVPVRKLDANAQHTDHLLNISDSDFVTGSRPDLASATKKFYRHFKDDFDFLNIVFALTRFQNRHHVDVHNAVRGIGKPLFDRTRDYGSGGRLQGLSVFPIASVFDGAETGYQHELGHQWINFLKVFPFETGAHWPVSSLAGGIMGFSIGGGQGGNYSCRLVPEAGGVRLMPRVDSPVFTDLDLYLMGLLPPDQVGDHLIFVDQNEALKTRCGGQLYTGGIYRLSASEIIRVAGQRVPDWTKSPRQFNVGTVIVSRTLLSDDEMSFYDFFAKRAEETREVPYHSGFTKGTAKPFALSTGGKASLNTGIASAARK